MNHFNQYIEKIEQEMQSPILTEAENIDALRNLFAAIKYANPFNRTPQTKAKSTAKGYAPDNVFVLVGGFEALPLMRQTINRQGISTSTSANGMLFDKDGKILHPTKLKLRLYKGLESSAKYAKDVPQISVYELLAGEFQQRRSQLGGKTIGKTGGLGIDESTAYLEIQKFIDTQFPNQILYMTPKDVARLQAEKEKGGLGKRAAEWGAGKVMQGVEGVKKDIQGYGDTLTPTTF